MLLLYIFFDAHLNFFAQLMFVQLAQVCFDIFSFRSNSLSEHNKMYISMFMHFATNYVCPAGPGLFC